MQDVEVGTESPAEDTPWIGRDESAQQRAVHPKLLAYLEVSHQHAPLVMVGV